MTDRESKSQEWLNRTFKQYQYLNCMGVKLERVEAAVNKSVNPICERETSGNTDLNPQEGKLLSFIELENQIHEKQVELLQEDKKTLDIIGKLSDTRQQAVLTMRYVERMRWRDIEATTHYSRSAVMAFHSDGLYNIYDYIPFVD